MAYVLCPGYVFSSDRDRHWINALELARLYRVNYDECKVRPRNDRGYHVQDGDIALHPQSSGDYRLPVR